LPIAERQYAIAYYSEYLMDAGPDGVGAAIDALGPPESLAAQIKADVAMRGLEPSTGQVGSLELMPPVASPGLSQKTADPAIEVPATAAVPAPAVSAPPATIAVPTPLAGAGSPPPPGSLPPPVPRPPQPVPTPSYKAQKSPVSVIVIVLLAIFALPIGLPVAIAIVALVISLFATVGSLVIAAAAVGLSLILAGGAFLAEGFVLLVSDWQGGVFYLGLGLVTMAVALLFNLGMYYLFRLIFKGIAKLFNGIRKKLSSRSKAGNREVSHA